nr:MAG TPA: hypothetical protein [Caudoviricetes sp.]
MGLCPFLPPNPTLCSRTLKKPLGSSTSLVMSILNTLVGEKAALTRLVSLMVT